MTSGLLGGVVYLVGREKPVEPGARNDSRNDAGGDPSSHETPLVPPPIRISSMSLSAVIPVYNERENIVPLYDAVTSSLRALGQPYEIVLVDDGSTDGSSRALDQLAARDPKVKVVHFRRNFGQTAAMNAGLHLGTGDVIVTLDADLQNDPADIAALLVKLDEGYDLVHGWRKDRQDAFINRKLPSVVANWIISKTTGFAVHDLGCTLKAMRREIAHDLQLYGEMHRFIPILAHWRGARCAEVVTRHQPRRFGTSKYGISRTFRVVLDLITVKYLIQYLTSPMKLFGGMGLTSLLLAGASGVATVAMKWFGQVDMTGNPFLLLTVFASLAGMQFIVLGMLGELCVRTYYESQNKQPYAIRSLVNFEAEEIEPRKAA
jgi:glycosyltransferase involved in cell wall biosynthesis